MPFCGQCGTQSSYGMKFCGNCGKAIDVVAHSTAGLRSILVNNAVHTGTQAPRYVHDPNNDPSLFSCFVKCLAGCLKFSGRARRREFAGFAVFSVVILATLFVIGPMTMGGDIGWALYDALGPIIPLLEIFLGGRLGTSGVFGWGLWLPAFYSIAMFLPFVSVGVRRMHDTNRSGWNILWILIPVIGIFIIPSPGTSGTVGPNNYGPDPKHMEV